MEKINLDEALEQIPDYWRPRVVGELNGQEVRLARIRGEFVWHSHDDADELFLVLAGTMVMRLRDREIEMSEGDMLVVPRGVEHRPESEEETHLLLFEPAGTLNTGNARNERTMESPERI